MSQQPHHPTQNSAAATAGCFHRPCRSPWRWGFLLLLVGGLTVYNGSAKVPTGPAAGVSLVGNVSPAPTPAPASAPGAATRPVLRVGTYNIHGGVGQDGREDLPRIAANLRGLDVIGLNEVHGGFNESNQARTLAGSLQMNYLFAPTEHQWWRDRFGNGVLSTLPVTHWARFPLPGSPGRGMRNLVLLKVSVQGQSRPVNVVVTHMDRQADGPAQRRLAAETFLSLEEPAVMMGDFNADATDPQIARLLRAPGVVDAIGQTMGPQKTPAHIDWIFVRGLSVLDAAFRDNGGSDHPAVWAELALP